MPIEQCPPALSPARGLANLLPWTTTSHQKVMVAWPDRWISWLQESSTADQQCQKWQCQKWQCALMLLLDAIKQATHCFVSRQFDCI